MHVRYKNLALIILIAAVTLPTLINAASYAAGNSYAPFGTVRAVNPLDDNVTITATSETTSTTSSEETTSSTVVVETTTSTTEAVTSTTEVVTSNTTSTTESVVTESTTVVTTTTTESSTQTTTEYSVVFEVNPSGAGTTNPSESGSYAAGSSIWIVATANSGYAFSSWSVSDPSAISLSDPSSASTSATINGFGTITANFNPTTVQPADTQTVVDCSPGSVEVGGSVTCTATVTGGPSVSGQTVSWGSAGSGIFDSVECTLGDTGSCSVTYSPTDAGDGSHTLTANYAGDAVHNASTGNFTLTVTGSTTITTTTMTSVTSTGDAKIWTDKADYAPGDTPTIYGSGFLANTEVAITVTRPEGTQNGWTVTADESGSFTTSYATDGLVSGTFTVTATDGTNTATTTFTDAINWNNECKPPATATVGATVTCTATGVGSSDRPAHLEWFDASSNLQRLSSPSCTTGSCSDAYAPGSPGTWTVKLVKDSDSSVRASTTFTVTAPADTTPPVLFLPADITAEATGPSGAVVTYTATATDAVDGPVPVTCAPSSGSTFPIGTTTVNCSASDSHGNTATGSFDVTVQDTTPPVLTLPADITAEATGPSGAPVSFTPSATDLVDGSVTVLCDYSSGDTFPLGTTTVHCSATDAHSNTATGSFDVAIQDTTPPALTVPADIVEEATGPSGATVTFSASASDIVDGPVSVTCLPSSGSTFSIATTTVTCSATDAQGNTGTASFSVKVQDTTPPTLTLPSPITAEATAPSGAIVSYSASATDIVDGSVTPTCTPVSGSTFPLGTTTVDCSATDAHGNTATGSFVVEVVDTTPPALTLPADFTGVEATGPGGAVVTFTATAFDLVDGSVPVSCTPSSGATFAIATTTVDCSATDAHTNTATGSFTVEVVDTTPPTVIAPSDITQEATGPAGAVVAFSASASDIVDGPITPICSPASGSTFPISTTTVTCTATDAHGNTGSASFHVTVQDTTPPVLTLPADITAEATGPSGAAVTYTATASDIVDGSVPVSCSPTSGSTFALGTTTVNCSASDSHGNTATGSFHVTVQDTTPPALSLPSDIVVIATSSSGAIVTYTATASDIVDGPVLVTCTPASGSLFPIGPTTVNCHATDSHGNTANGSFKVSVQYAPVGTMCLGSPGHQILQPINSDGTSVFKKGSTVPAKFRVCDANGNSIGTPGVVVSFKLIQKISGTVADVDEPVFSTTPDTAFRWSPTDQQWIFNINTKNLQAGYTYVYLITLNDGTTIQFQFGLK